MLDPFTAEPDLFFVLGVILAIFCIPSLFSAWTTGRTPRVTSITVTIAAGMMAWGAAHKPNGYDFASLPGIFADVLTRYAL